jgi:hypothetical protein
MHIVFEMKHNVHMLICINNHDFGSNKFTHDSRMSIQGTKQQQQQQLPFHWSPPTINPRD